MAAAAMCALVTAVILLREARYRTLEARVLTAVNGTTPDYRTMRLGGLGGFLHSIGERVLKSSRIYSEKDVAGIESMIAVSGFNPRRVLPIVLGGKIVLTVLIPAAAVFYCYFASPTAMTRAVVISVSIPVGLLGPDWVLAALRRPYTAALQRGVIDALDLLVVCSEAGLGLESALERVTQEMLHSNRPTANALGGLLDEIRVLPDRREAFANFAKRSGVDGMQRLATMLAQSLQYGTPLGQALRAVAVELRRQRMIKLEERAAKLPAKLVLPLILFIMPCLLIVLVGSSFLRLFDMLGAITN
ncbi:MAG: type II secretion system F family protein [Rhodopila sp.]|nr:type II secretion system F family protein [Rhodopila sp.]